MQDLDGSDFNKRITAEIHDCFTYEEEKKNICVGASGRKLRQVCVWCPNYRKREGEKHEKNH